MLIGYLLSVIHGGFQMIDSYRKMSFHIIIIGILILASCSGPKESKDAYIKAKLGVELENGERIPFGIKVQKLENPDSAKEFVKILHNEKEYSIPTKYLSSTPPRIQFAIIEPQGLNFREGPGTQFPKISTLPMGTKGLISEIEPKMFTIQKQTGYWFSSEINGKKGWLFSGFILTKDLDEKTESVDSDSEGRGFHFSFPASETPDSVISRSGFEVLQSTDFSKYTIQHLKNNQPDEFDQSCGFELSIRVTGNQQLFHFTGGNFSFSNLESAKNGFIFYSTNHCGCCCAPSEDDLVIVSNDRIRKLSYQSFGREGMCDTQEGSFLMILDGVEFRLDSENSTLYLLRKEPVCDTEGKFEGENENFKVYERLGTNFYFYKFSNKDGNYSEERKVLDSEEIPEDLVSDWENAKRIGRENE